MLRPSWSTLFWKVSCPRCGLFELESIPQFADTLNQEDRDALSCAARQAHEAGPDRALHLTAANALRYSAEHRSPRVSDNFDHLIAIIASRIVRPTGNVQFQVETDFTLIDCRNAEEFRWYLDRAAEERLIGLKPPDRIPAFVVNLTLKGWQYAQPLLPRSGTPGRCFVAMSFDPSLDEAFELGIKPAVKDCDMDPIRIDKKEHNNQITDEMMAEIQEAEFMIADFTGQRGSVYYEAGFARGLGRPVIYCCRADDFDKLHFDTRIINHIKWLNPADLREQTANRIKATIIRSA